MKHTLLLLLALLAFALAACSNTGDPDNPKLNDFSTLPPGDATRGESLFNGQKYEEIRCSACHSLNAGETLAGPSLAGIATTAASRQSGVSAENYIYHSIIAPDSYLVEGFHEGIMPSIYQKRLSAQELADLVAFLLSQ